MAFKKIGGLWKKQDRNGQDYLCGKIGEKPVFVFKKKDIKDNQPHYEIFTTDDKEE